MEPNLKYLFNTKSIVLCQNEKINHYLEENLFMVACCSICSSLILPSCAEVPITNRKQLNFYKYNLPIILPSGGIGGLPQIYANEEII